MSDPFSPELLARLRDDARRLAARSASHQGEIRKHLVAAEANLEHVRTAWSEHSAFTPAGSLSQALRAQVTRSYAEVDAAQRLCVSAGENQSAAERLVTDLGGQPKQLHAAPAYSSLTITRTAASFCRCCW